VEEPSPKLTIAGVLDIVAGVMSLIGACVLLILGVIGSGALGIAGAQNQEVMPFAVLPIAFFLPLALLCFVIGAVAVAGGIAAIKRQRLWLALVGSIAAVISCFLIGIPAVILTVMAEKEFQRR
jgi:hypothetical protein